MITSASAPRVNPDWFVSDDPGAKFSYGRLKTEYTDIFYDTMKKMHEAQMKECAQARENLTDRLTPDQLNYLSSKYDPKNMSFSEYRSFVDDLCKFGYFAEADKPNVSCGYYGSLNMIPASYLPSFEGYISTAPYTPGCASLCPPDGGNILAWVKYQASLGKYNPNGVFEKTEQARVFERLQEILVKIDR